MRIALLTPMKPPDHPVPSGDRTFARLIRAALVKGGHEVDLPSTLTTWCRTPEDLPQIEAAAAAEVERITALWRAEGPPDAVLTYHNYHKAPDLIGPALARAFALPFAIVEPSRAPRRAEGPWARGFALADDALAAAGALGAVTTHDAKALYAHAPDKVRSLPPFIDTEPFRRARTPRSGAIVSAAMFRPGRKADSVRVLAAAYTRMRARRPDVRLTLAGDGAERAALEPLFPPGTLIGLLSQDALADLYACSSLFVWPAIDEPFGFTFLEAQAAGLPVVAGRTRGVVDVVLDNGTGRLVTPDDPAAITAATLELLFHRDRLTAFSARAVAFAAQNDLNAGLARLNALIAAAARRNAAR